MNMRHCAGFIGRNFVADCDDTNNDGLSGKAVLTFIRSVLLKLNSELHAKKAIFFLMTANLRGKVPVGCLSAHWKAFLCRIV